MKNKSKNEKIYQTIGEVTEKLGLIDKKTGRPQTHTLRYWESQFKQIKPSIRAGNRRYYSDKDFKIISYQLKCQMLVFLGQEKIHAISKMVNSDKIEALN